MSTVDAPITINGQTWSSAAAFWYALTTDQRDALIAACPPPGFHAFEALAERFLTNYPADVFDGTSGDPGSCFVVRLREAVDTLKESTR